MQVWKCGVSAVYFFVMFVLNSRSKLIISSFHCLLSLTHTLFYLLLTFYLSHFCYNPTSLCTEASTFICLTYFLPIYLSCAYLHIEKSLRTYSTFICILFYDFYSWWFSLSSLHILDINTLFVMNASNIFSYSTISLISVYDILIRIEILNFM